MIEFGIYREVGSDHVRPFSRLLPLEQLLQFRGGYPGGRGPRPDGRSSRWAAIRGYEAAHWTGNGFGAAALRRPQSIAVVWLSTALWNIDVSHLSKSFKGAVTLRPGCRYHVSCEPLRIFWNDDTTCSTQVPRVLSTTGWKARNPARSRQHAWYSCRAGCIVISENPQGLATHMVQSDWCDTFALCTLVVKAELPATCAALKKLTLLTLDTK